MWCGWRRGAFSQAPVAHAAAWPCGGPVAGRAADQRRGSSGVRWEASGGGGRLHGGRAEDVRRRPGWLRAAGGGGTLGRVQTCGGAQLGRRGGWMVGCG